MSITENQIEAMIVEISGQEGLPIYKALKGKVDVNEFLLAEKLKLTINQVRNILYRLESHNLLTSNRKKDRKKGWYIYFWTFLEDRAERAYITLKRTRIQMLQTRIDRERTNQFYICMNKCTRANVETAMENQFMCVECGQLMVPDDNTKTINRIQGEINELTTEVEKLESERPKIEIEEEEEKPIKKEGKGPIKPKAPPKVKSHKSPDKKRPGKRR